MNVLKKIICILSSCSLLIVQNSFIFAANGKILETDQAMDQTINQTINPASDSTEVKQGKTGELIVCYYNKADDSQKTNRIPKIQIVKNVFTYFTKLFFYELKSYVKFYPLIKVSQLISYVGILLPLYVLYKETGIDVPEKVSNFMIKHENLAIIINNIYYVIPTTLAAFLFKYGNKLYSYFMSNSPK